jgi:hypothetical protein
MSFDSKQFKTLIACRNSLLVKERIKELFGSIPHMYLPRYTYEYFYLKPLLKASNGRAWAMLYCIALPIGLLRRLFASLICIKNESYAMPAGSSRILFISNFVGDNQTGVNDIYIGEIIKNLSSNRKEFDILYFSRNRNIDTEFAVLPAIGTFRHEASIFFTLLLRAFAICREFICASPKGSWGLLTLAFFCSMSNWSAEIELRKRQFREYLKKVKPQILFLPFEGLAIESVLMREYRNMVPGGRIVLYQQVPIYESSIDILSPFHKSCYPDNILFSSNLYLKLFLNDHLDFDKDKCAVLGSGRAIAPKALDAIKPNINNDKNYYFVPVGIHAEVAHYLELIEKIMQLESMGNFFLSFHPLMLEDAKFKRKVQQLVTRGLIFRTSVRELNELVNPFTSYVVFTGSSSFISMCAAGCIPVVYAHPASNGFDITPAFVIREDVPVVSSASELKDLISRVHYSQSLEDRLKYTSIFSSAYEMLDNNIINSVL